MKIGNLLIKIGKKISSKKQKKDKSNSENENKENIKLSSSSDSDDWPCWWVFNKPPLPKIFKK